MTGRKDHLEQGCLHKGPKGLRDNPSHEGSFDVFVSHIASDGPVARLLAQGLSAKGLKVWLAEDQIAPGDSVIERISSAMKDSRMSALIVSSEADASKPSISREWAAAQECAWSRKDFLVVSVVLDGAELPVFLHGWPHLALDRQDPDIGAAVESITRILEGNAPSGVSSPENADKYRTAAVERFSQIKHSINEQMEEVARTRGEGLHE